MRSPDVVERLGEWARSLGAFGLAVRAVHMIAVTVFLISIQLSGADIQPLLVIVVAIATLVVGWRPDSQLGIVEVGLLVFAWWASATSLAMSLVPALALLCVHVCVAHAAAVPPRTKTPSAAMGRLGVDVGVVAVATTAVWLVVLAFERVDGPALVPVTVAGLLTVAAAGLLLGRRSFVSEG